MVHWAWNPMRKRQADGTKERSEIATVWTVVAAAGLRPSAEEAGLWGPRGLSGGLFRGGVCRAGPGRHEQPSMHLLPGTWCLVPPPLPLAGFPSPTAPCPLFGNTGDSPNTQLDSFKVAVLLFNVYLLVFQAASHVAGVQ